MKAEIYIRGDTQKVLCLTPENQKEQDFIDLWNSVKGDDINIIVNNFLPEEKKTDKEEFALPIGERFTFAEKEWINNYGERPIINSNFDTLTVAVWKGEVEYLEKSFSKRLADSICWKGVVGYRIVD